jgi:hypothetical protein
MTDVSALERTTDLSQPSRHVRKVPISEVNQRCFKPSILPLPFGLVLPVVPLHIIDFEITGDGYADGREEVALA